jgi:hypothetical protein
MNMKNKILVWVLIVIIIVLGLVVILQNRKNNVVPTGDEINQLIPNENADNNFGQNNVVNNPVQNTPTNNVVSDCLPSSPSTIKVLSPNGGETFTTGQQITVKWKSCNVAPNSIGIVLIKHNPSISYAQSEGQGDYAGFSLGGFDPYVGTANDGSQQVTLPSASVSNFVSGQHYFIAVTGLGDATHIGSGYSPRDYSDNLFTINSAVNQNNIITKNDWGVSFTKTSDWDIVTNTSSEVSLKQNAGQWVEDIIKINYVSGQSITDTDAKFGNITYYYNGSSNQWMKTTNENGAVTSIATTSSYTVDGFPVFPGTGRWKTYIIPTSHTTFIKLNIGGSGYSQPLTDLVQTIKKI